MKAFMTAAMPWICIGIVLALAAANHDAAKKAKECGKTYDNYMELGLCMGMALGLSFGADGMIYGMLTGMAIGMCIKKEG